MATETNRDDFVKFKQKQKVNPAYGNPMKNIRYGEMERNTKEYQNKRQPAKPMKKHGFGNKAY